ncbi:MAG TPA: hypothetical protein VHR45_03395 [Thermoanaerobaculia bacterium]|nr:hypothetical protein [Thermoanaerobaculia bacterium]
MTPEVEAELAEVAAGCGCELIHAEWKGAVLRLTLDRAEHEQSGARSRPPGRSLRGMPPGHGGRAAAARPSPDGRPTRAGDERGDPASAAEEGVSLADCERVARQVSALLDVLDFGAGRYLLEVSSPGLDRPLYRPRDYHRFLGRRARVTFEEPGAHSKKTVSGRLAELHPSPTLVQAAPPAQIPPDVPQTTALPSRRSAATSCRTCGDWPGAPPGGELEAVTVIDDRGARHTIRFVDICSARLEIEL